MKAWPIVVVGALGTALFFALRRKPKRGAASVTPPPPPVGWQVLQNNELTPSMRQKAIEVLNSSAPMGSLTQFQDGGETFGAFVTVHPGTTRAVEIWRPA